MFCRVCGTQLPPGAKFCPHCGSPAEQISQYAPPPQYQTQTQYNTAQAPAQSTTNSIAIVGFVLSFFVPIAGLICSIFGLIKTGKGAPYKGLAIAGIVISAIGMIVQFFLMIGPLMDAVESLLTVFFILPLLLIFAGVSAG